MKKLPNVEYSGGGGNSTHGSSSGSNTPSRSLSRSFKTLPIVSKISGSESEKHRKNDELLVHSNESLSYDRHSTLVAKKLRSKKKEKEKERESTEEESAGEPDAERLYEMITQVKKDVDTINDTITRFSTLLENHQKLIATSESNPTTTIATLDVMDSESEESLFSYYCCCCCGGSSSL